MNLCINIATHAAGPTEFALIGTDTMKVGQKVELAPGIEATWQGTLGFKSAAVPNVIEFAVAVGAGVLGNVIGDTITGWLRRGMKEPPVYIEINNVRITTLDEEKMRQLIAQEVDRARRTER